jgi:putative DNA primase/helicase
MMGNLSRIFGESGFDASRYTDRPLSDHPEHAFADALAAFGIVIEESVATGVIKRCKMADQRKGNKRNGWYLFFGLDPVTNIAAGVYGDWRHDDRQYWSSKPESQMDVREHALYKAHIKKMQEQVEAEKKARQAEAAQEAESIIARSQPAAGHAYLTKKQVKPYGLYADGDALIVPMRNAAGELRSLQRIYPNGDKRFLAGGQTSGCFHLIGQGFTEPTYLAEGYATGATIHALTKKSVVVAFTSGNLLSALDGIRASGVGNGVIIAADNDRRTEGNPGVSAAKKVAEAHPGVQVIAPSFRGEQGTDFNDLYFAEGGDEVLRQIGASIVQGPTLKLSRVTDMDLAKPIDYLIDDFLVEETTSLIWGPPGCGKSFVAIDMGLHIATGMAWHGHEVSQGDVVYVCGEGFNGIPLRVGAWTKHHDYEGPIPFYMTHEAVPIAKPGAAQSLIASIKAVSERPKLVIIDTLNRNFGGGSESDQDDMDLYLDASHILVKDLGCNVLTVHHSGKDPTRGPRGSTALPGAVYSNMEMCKPREGEWSLTTHKQKDGPEAPPVSINLVPVPLGEAEDNRGRVRSIGSLVVEVVDDLSIGASIAANITGKGRRKKLTSNQQILLGACRGQVQNIPEGMPITVDKKQLFESLKVVGFDGPRRSEALKWAKDSGILTPISDRNEHILVFKDPAKNYGY